MEVSEGWEKGGAMLTPTTTSFYFWGFFRMWEYWWKWSNKCDRESAHRRIHGYTDLRKPVFTARPHSSQCRPL